MFSIVRSCCCTSGDVLERKAQEKVKNSLSIDLMVFMILGTCAIAFFAAIPEGVPVGYGAGFGALAVLQIIGIVAMKCMESKSIRH